MWSKCLQKFTMTLRLKNEDGEVEVVSFDVDFCAYTNLNEKNLKANKPTVAKGLDIRDDSVFFMGYWGGLRLFMVYVCMCC